ncbi:Paraneoplastic antigen Ma1 [Merluccius polli]|uniref:Paraneoplastic antigen Ma1 n=1 Tax=Merluccius polli TaxID=89951 RepID=A0AA47MCT0_MERPO|nr:Paraneoplastic antigen Ma1 [Merluccius polli]
MKLVKELEKQHLPLHRACTANLQIVHHVQSLGSVYSSEVSASATVAYLTELKDLAQRSSKSFEDILREELARIGESVGRETQVNDTETPAEPAPTPLTDEPRVMPPISDEDASSVSITPQTAEAVIEITSHEDGKMHSPQPPAELHSTPEVQRVIVEHIVRSNEMASQSNLSYKLKPFSGRVPHPAFEVDYDAWRSSVEFCLNDPVISDTQVVRKIVESLSSPAANIVKSLGPKATPKAFLKLLDSAYATVEDGDELFARFLNTNQNVGEKASDYLQRLHTTLSSVISREGIVPNDADKQLLRQFCHGCWDSPLLMSLQLEQHKTDPPSFAEFLLLLRTEEDKQASKATRMKHLGITKTRALSHVQTTLMSSMDSFDTTSDPDSVSSAAHNDLKKEIADLHAEIAQLKACSIEKPVKKASKETKKQLQKTQNESAMKEIKPERKEMKQITATLHKPKPWYCFRCCEDAHIASSCNNDPNPVLVEAKRRALREKQRVWEISNTPDISDLN